MQNVLQCNRFALITLICILYKEMYSNYNRLVNVKKTFLSLPYRRFNSSFQQAKLTGPTVAQVVISLRVSQEPFLFHHSMLI